MSLEQAVLVTGAGRRVGHHLANRLTDAGFCVLAHYRSETPEVHQLQQRGIATIQGALDHESAIMDLLERVDRQCASLRAIVHNASSFTPTATDLHEAAAQYQAFFAVHMLAPFLLSQGLIHKLRNTEGEAADIVHITDINVENPTPRFDVYGTTKAGLHNLTLALAKKYAPSVKVNAIAPGPVWFMPEHSEAVRAELLAETPLGKEGGPEPVYLALKALLDNPFVTGVSLPVDGGRRLTKR